MCTRTPTSRCRTAAGRMPLAGSPVLVSHLPCRGAYFGFTIGSASAHPKNLEPTIARQEMGDDGCRYEIPYAGIPCCLKTIRRYRSAHNTISRNRSTHNTDKTLFLGIKDPRSRAVRLGYERAEGTSISRCDCLRRNYSRAHGLLRRNDDDIGPDLGDVFA